MDAGIRVDELAAELGWSTAQLLAHVAALSDDPPRADDSGVSDDLAAKLRALGPERSKVVALIREAFTLARESGKDAWHRMQAGVLKNRLLLLTANEFDEEPWGTRSFTSFLELFPELVLVDRESTPPVVELLDAGDGDRPAVGPGVGEGSRSTPGRPTGPWRIRSDFWSSVVDYSSGDIYVWDEGAVRAIPADAYRDGDPRPRLPTVTGDELQAWRQDFAEQHAPRAGRAEGALSEWARSSMSSWSLPRHLRDAWFVELKERVRERLEGWFETTQVPPPDDLVETGPARGRPRVREADSTAELRALIVRCVGAMTRAELEEVRLPPAAVLRSRS